MRSIALAVSSFLSGLLLGHTSTKKYEPEAVKVKGTPALENYIAFHFRCWLCDGQTGFGLKPSADERMVKMDCSRCGVENVIKVKPTLQRS